MDKYVKDLQAQFNGEHFDFVNLDNENCNITARSVGVFRQRAIPSLLELIINSNLQHAVNVADQEVERHIELSREMISRENLFCSNFPAKLKEIFEGDYEGDLFVKTFTSSCEKMAVLDVLEEHIGKIRSINRIKKNIRLVADELVTNVLYNGPSSNKDAPEIKPIDRKQQVTIGPEQGKIFAFVCRDNLCLGTVDTFGSLPIERVLKKLHNTYLQGIDKAINKGPGGAGVGIRLSFDLCKSLILAVDRWQTTGIAFVIPFGKNKELDNLPKTIHIINKG